MDVDSREYELVCDVSLRDLDADALLRLRRDGECTAHIPEARFDLDTPGHYMRRIKSVSIEILGVTGPEAPVRCTLTLISSSVRLTPEEAGGYRRTGANDSRFRDAAASIQSIVTSRAPMESGHSEKNVRDARHLAFEGAGAISEWRIELPKGQQFDRSTISDVVLHIRYTAREGGSALKQLAAGAATATLAHRAGTSSSAPARRRR